MKLIGGQDFYDSAAQFGVDEETIFVRSGESVEAGAFKGASWPFFPSLTARLRIVGEPEGTRIGSEYWRILPFVLIVAGVRHAGLHVEPVFADPSARASFLWSYDAYAAWRLARGAERPRAKVPAYRSYDAQRAFFEDALTEAQTRWLVENRVVVATAFDEQPDSLGAPRAWRVNGDDLKHFQFFHRIGAAELFQQIAGYIGGVLGGPAPDTVEIVDDAVLRDKKGFDEKSFKREKQVGTKRRRGRKA